MPEELDDAALAAEQEAAAKAEPDTGVYIFHPDKPLEWEGRTYESLTFQWDGLTGSLGDVAFTVSRDLVRTLDKFQWSGSARYGVHQRHAGNALTEFTGLDPDQISLDLTFSAELGTNPMEEIWRLFRYERNGTTLPLTLGEHAYGRFRWTILSHTTKAQHFDKEGNLYHAVVSVKLQEYLRD